MKIMASFDILNSLVKSVTKVTRVTTGDEAIDLDLKYF